MAEPFSWLARDRLQQLSGNFVRLRERVREAVASEMGKAVGEALRDLLTVILCRNARAQPIVVPQPTVTSDPWDEDQSELWSEGSRPLAPAWQPDSPLSAPVPSIGLAVMVTHWLLRRRAPLWAGLGAGLIAGLATFSKHPILQASLGVLAAATELIVLTEHSSPLP